MKRIWILLILSVAAIPASADFSNLDFESYSGSGDALLPGWSRNSANYMWPLLDMVLLATSGLGLVSTNSGSSFVQPSAGTYSAYISAGVGMLPDHSVYVPVQISQTATVPLNAAALSFVVFGYDPANVQYAFTLDTIDLLSGTSEDLGGGHTRFSQSISSLAGSNVTLSFGFLFTGAGGASPSRDHTLDSVTFESIPEPATLSMLLAGGLLLMARRRRIAS